MFPPISLYMKLLCPKDNTFFAVYLLDLPVFVVLLKANKLSVSISIMHFIFLKIPIFKIPVVKEVYVWKSVRATFQQQSFEIIL